MPENQIPATQPEPGAAPGEFNFTKPTAENPRMRRRSLKAKPGGLIKPSGSTVSAARELEREAPPLSVEQVVTPPSQKAVEAKIEPDVEPAKAPVAPPRTTPSTAPAATSSIPTLDSAKPKAIAASASAPVSASSPAASPHGTRPATLYYSSYPRKATAPSPMKTIPSAGPASTSSTGASPSSAARSATSSPRPAPTVDYRANVERQSREQKSVGNILAYAVYALIAFFVISAGLAAYGADVIFKQIHDQSLTVSDLDQRYAAANKDLNAKLAVTQDSLTQSQAEIARQQDLIVKQQEELNRLIAATNDDINALKLEKQARTQETMNLRARVRDLEDRSNSTQKF